MPSKSAPADKARREKFAKKHATRAEQWSRKADELREKSKNAATHLEREAFAAQAKKASKKSHEAAAKVEKTLGSDHAVTRRARGHADRSVGKKHDESAKREEREWGEKRARSERHDNDRKERGERHEKQKADRAAREQKRLTDRDERMKGRDEKAWNDRVERAKQKASVMDEKQREKVKSQAEARAKFWAKKSADYEHKIKLAKSKADENALTQALKTAESKGGDALAWVHAIRGLVGSATGALGVNM
jgi:hypothetical protein